MENGIVRELDRLGLLVHLVHRVIDDPGELEDVLLDQVELLGDLDAHRAEDLGGLGFVGVGGEEDDGRMHSGKLLERRRYVSHAMNFAIGPAISSFTIHFHIRQPRRAEFLRFLLQIIEPRARLIEGLRHGQGAHGLARERLELALGEKRREILDLKRNPHIGLVGAEAEQRFLVGECAGTCRCSGVSLSVDVGLELAGRAGRTAFPSRRRHRPA